MARMYDNTYNIMQLGSVDLLPWTNTGPDCRHRWDLESSFRFCRNLALNHYENFPIFLEMLDPERRDALAAVYAFARLADDFADEKAYSTAGPLLVDAWRRRLDDCFEGRAGHPVFVALAWAANRFSIDAGLFHDLLDAFEQDLRLDRYATFDEILAYCRRSANPVGRIVLRIFGDDGDDNLSRSDNICTALQLTNFWQDISVDAAKGRLYLPLEDLEHFGVSTGQVLSGIKNDRMEELIRFQVDRTRTLFRHGRPLISAASYPHNLYLACVWLGGRTLLRMVKDMGAEVVRTRPRLGKRRIARTWLAGGMDRLTHLKDRTPWTH